jgi:hypothetical protein
LFFTAANFPRQGAMRRVEKVGDDGVESYLVDIGVAPQDAARLVKRVHKECSLSIANFNMPDEYVAAYFEQRSLSFPAWRGGRFL